MRDGARLDLVGEGARILETRRMGEHRIGIFAREFYARVGGARLENDWLTLRGAANIEGTRDLEETPLVVERVQLCPVEELSGLAVADDRVLVPAVPQPLRDFEILA